MANNKVTFQLDLVPAGQNILQEMALEPVLQSGQAIAARAEAMTESLGQSIGFDASGGVGVIKKGRRAIVRVMPTSSLNAFENEIAWVVLQKAKNAGSI
jgi:hypothetical protein